MNLETETRLNSIQPKGIQSLERNQNKANISGVKTETGQLAFRWFIETEYLLNFIGISILIINFYVKGIRIEE